LKRCEGVERADWREQKKGCPREKQEGNREGREIGKNKAKTAKDRRRTGTRAGGKIGCSQL